MSKETVTKIFEESISVISESKKLSGSILKATDVIIDHLKKNNKILLFGNGGSAADAQHFAAELVGKYKIKRSSLPAIALTTDTSILTAIGNDFGFEDVFARQCESLVNKEDVVLAISTSGTSQNVINGILSSKKKGAYVIGLCGFNATKMSELSDLVLAVPSNSTPKIQEVHRIIMHIICELIDKEYE